MQDDKKLPDDLGTAHEVILVQSDTLVKLKEKNDELNKSLQEALAEIRFLRSGKKREKFINADQLLLEFPEDKELQASLEAARKEAEEESKRSLTYARRPPNLARLLQIHSQLICPERLSKSTFLKNSKNESNPAK